MQYSAELRYPQSFRQSVAAVIACSHYHSPIVKYGTVEKSNLAKCRQDDLCCRRTIRRWNPEARSFRLMYGTPAADEKIFIHTPVSTKSSVQGIAHYKNRRRRKVLGHTTFRTRAKTPYATTSYSAITVTSTTTSYSATPPLRCGLCRRRPDRP